MRKKSRKWIDLPASPRAIASHLFAFGMLLGIVGVAAAQDDMAQPSPDASEGSSPGTIGHTVYANPRDGGWFYWPGTQEEEGFDVHLANAGNLVSFTLRLYAPTPDPYDATIRFYAGAPDDSVTPLDGPPLVEVTIPNVPGNTGWDQTIDLPDLGMSPVAVPADLWVTSEFTQFGGPIVGSIAFDDDFPVKGTAHNSVWLGSPDNMIWGNVGGFGGIITLRLEHPAGIERLDDPSQFSGSETLIDFDDVVYPYSSQYGPLGVTITTINGVSGGVDDPEWATRHIHNSPPGSPFPRPDMLLTFCSPKTRVGFDFETNFPDDLILTLLADGEVVHEEFIVTQFPWMFIGMESDTPFDQVLINVTENQNGFFRLDNLRFEPSGGGPANDTCATATPISDGVLSVDTRCATTTGPAHAECQFDGQTYNDIWYSYTAECTGELLVTSCEQLGGTADYDTDIVVYDGDDCTALNVLGCNDDDPDHICGTAAPWHSTVRVNVVRGETYLVRIGGWGQNDRGTGDLVVALTPDVLDSDGDGLDDCDEVQIHGTDPDDPDTDGDGLSDGDEVALAAFGGCPDPLVADSDMDGLPDGAEVNAGLDPCDADSDMDGLADGLEGSFGTDPLDPDTDDDGLLDGTEVDMAEGAGCPDPTVADSDGDTLNDGHEVTGVGTDPCNPDTDGDMVPDNGDPLPLEPGVTSGFIEDAFRSLCDFVADTPLDDFDAPNNNAAKGRRNAMCNKLRAVATLVADEEWQEAIDKVEDDLLPKVDGANSPKDWLHDGVVRNIVRDELELLAFLMSLEL